MTVSHRVAGLLPIMWSTRVGAEMMKPLATPVLGRHGLVAAPRACRHAGDLLLASRASSRLAPRVFAGVASPPMLWRPIVAAVAAVALLSAGTLMWRRRASGRWPRRRRDDRTARAAAALGRSADCSAVTDRHAASGTEHIQFEFRATNGRLVDVGTVRASGNMPMPGMVMSSGHPGQRTQIAGRYDATAEFGMAGAWHMTLEWDGPAGPAGSTSKGRCNDDATLVGSNRHGDHERCRARAAAPASTRGAATLSTP